MGSLKVSREFFLLTFLVILASFVFYNFINEDFIYSFLGILFGVMYYVTYLIYMYKFNPKREHNEVFVEALAVISLFLFPVLAFGFKLFNGHTTGIILVVLFAVMQILNFVRNWSNGVNHTKGFPVLLHGVFFPLTYFVSHFYAQSFQEALFMLYFVVTGVLSATTHNFVKYQHSVFESNNSEPLEVRNKEAVFEKPLIEVKKSESNLQMQESDEEILSSIEPVQSLSHKIKNLTKDEISQIDEEIFNSIPKIEIKKTEEEYVDDFDEEDEQFLNSISKA